MVSKILFVVDGSLPCDELPTLAHRLLPEAPEVLILQVVPQLPRAWIAWPAFPDPAEEVAKATEYVSGIREGLHTLGWNVGTKVYFSPLSAGEMDREILKLAETLQPDLICLAMERGSVRAAIVRKASVPVLVANSPSPDGKTEGLREQRRAQREPVAVHRAILVKPAAALLFRRAGIL